jgi:vacuolar-type H+-ATPase subunit I/STV1
MLVPMKKVNLFAMIEDRDHVLRALQKAGDVMFVPTADDKVLPHASEVADEAAKASDAIKFLEQHAPAKLPCWRLNCRCRTRNSNSLRTGPKT